MEAEEVLKLMDSYWFEHLIIMHKHQREESVVSEVQNIRFRSLSDRCLDVNISNYCKEEAKLERILSGKEVFDFSREFPGQEKADKSKKQYSWRKKWRKEMSRSLSALEFEELKGFMDLGFSFSEEDKNPGLVSIIPGLQKWGKMADEVSRTWGVLNKRNLLMNWRIPSVQNEIDMKDHLRIWAYTVASTVK